ncbi:hypothetical protein [Allokutzneria albata]|uniref:Uncharacterized protein n=1 Tax=Allokutzneria albata TaxID=211114 RepID=A0A1G9SE98_ALLAB|nr:hypothetical protein [Allokutzneria albata]SDM33793.1 hypothetical protein SAMN04489726_1111 [Allokutzneria albata]
MIAVVSFVTLVSTTSAAMATVVVCWALHAGFVLGRWGELVFTARSANDALVLVVCALAA